MDKQTPMMEQYLKIKEENRGAILLFHLGDFYEMFFEDAETAARVLHITLTSRGKGEKKMPMAGIPCRASENYIARLIKAGYKVAICEQTEDPAKSKGLVRREVTRVITPGTVIESPLLEAKANNYILSFNVSGETFGIAFADVTTGEFRMTEASGFDRFHGEVSRISPREAVFPEEAGRHPAVEGLLSLKERAYSPVEGWKFSPETARRELESHFGVATLDGFGAEDCPLGTACAGALISYLKDTQKTSLGHINRLRFYSLSDFMVLDRATRKNLEIVQNLRDGSRAGTLLEAMDGTSGAGGGRLLRQWLLAPLINASAILERQEAVSELFEDNAKRKRLRGLLSGINDLERLVARISCRRASARDVAALKDSLESAKLIKKELAGAGSALAKKIADGISDMDDVCSAIEKTIADDPPVSVREGGIIREGADIELDRLRSIRKDGKQWIARLQEREIERSGINSLRVGYNKVFGYYIEVTKANLKDVPPDYTRKQTLVNAERFITPELKEHEARVFGAAERIVEMEYGIFCCLREMISRKVKEIQAIAHSISVLDVIAGLAETAVNRRYVRPSVDEGALITVREGRHPVMEIAPGGRDFVPNSLELDSDSNRILIITGPNMAGKSTFIRQSALLVIMAQTGSYIPAAEAKIGVADRIFTRVGASDDIAGGRSTFMVEMNETANILANATSRSLIILDEIGRGTSTYDGVSIAWAVVEYIHNHPVLKAKTLFATHYHELTSLSETLPSVKNFCVLVREWNGKIIFLRKVAPGRTDKSYGIHVARLAGLPDEVIDRAGRILKSLETGARQISSEKSRGITESASQPSLFELQENGRKDEVVEELKNIKIEALSPLEALNLLARVKEKADGTG